ncbi:unnamed protein product [Gadus morhua 'NCC']
MVGMKRPPILDRLACKAHGLGRGGGGGYLPFWIYPPSAGVVGQQSAELGGLLASPACLPTTTFCSWAVAVQTGGCHCRTPRHSPPCWGHLLASNDFDEAR